MSDDGELLEATATVEHDALEVRFARDEERIADEEARLVRDEARLARDEERLELEEQAARVNRLEARLSVALVGVLAVAVAGLIVAVIALREQVHTLSTAAPDGSVATSAIQDSAVTAPKLAPGAVTRIALGRHAVGRRQLALNAVAGRNVLANSLTGADIREGTLGTVPSAQTAGHARSAGDSAALGGLPYSAYLSRVRIARASSSSDTRSAKGPITASCPAGTRVVSGGAQVVGTDHGVALVRSGPGGRAWTAFAAAYRKGLAPWRLTVTAICAAGGR